MECLTNWKNFYARLYASKSVFASQHPRVYDDTLDKPFTYEELVLVIASLVEHKSHGADYISANDMTILIHIDPEDPSFADENRFLIKYILSVINTFWDKEKAILIPILKNIDCDTTNPTNYRPISLLNTLMKLYEGLIKKRLVNKLETLRLLTPIQAAYRKGRSTCDHLLILQELFLKHRFSKGAQKTPLYLYFMDLAKAFDTVPRKILFRKLRKLGIKGKMLRVISDLYTRNIARVQVGNYLSPNFEINKGVMQGSKLGPILFLIFINDLLNELHTSRLGAQIAYHIISGLGFADDIVLISDVPGNLQKLINICDNWAHKNQMSFNLDKCNVMVFNVNSLGLRFHIRNETLKVVSLYKYLGILLSSGARQKTLYKEHFAKILEKALARLHCIRHLGFHKHGLRPHTAIRMYKALVRPILEYGAQALSYKKYFLNSSREPADLNVVTFFTKDLENFQTRALKILLNCPRNVSPALLRILTGVEPMACRLDIPKLR